MALNAGEEFNLMAAPSPELLRKLAYLATQDNDSVLTGSAREGGNARGKGADRTKAERADMLLQMARLADPGYQALSARINAKLDMMDEASVHALQEIESDLLTLRKEREAMREQAYRDEQGRAVFMSEDGTGAWYEDGRRVDDEEFGAIRERLDGRPTWDAWQANQQEEDSLKAERDLIHRHEGAREELREAVAQGAISKEEAERRERELEEALPERVRDHFRSLRGETADHDGAARDADSDLALSVEEEARHNTGLSSPDFTPS